MRLTMWILMWSGALVFLAAVALAGCSKPQHLHVTFDGDNRPVVSWNSTAAMGLYVTSPDAQLPSGPDDLVKGGHVYWVVEATTFPSGFGSPVVYGVIPDGGKDATAKHGGTPGGEPLEAGTPYKFGVVSLGGQMEIDDQW